MLNYFCGGLGALAYVQLYPYPCHTGLQTHDHACHTLAPVQSARPSSQPITQDG